MLRDYEILYIVRPELDEDGVGTAVQTVETLIKNLGGESGKTDVWGRRRLAYEVAHLREGTYVLTDFKLEAERVREMDSTLKISDTVFRYLITRKPEKARAGARSAGGPAGQESRPAAVAATAAAPAEAEAPPQVPATEAGEESA